MAPPYRTFHNLESQFATNHVGHFLFTNLILPKILATPTPRIVNVTSVGHTIAGVQFDDLNFGDGKNYHPWKAYGQSKSANILFTRSLAAKHSAKLLAFAVHPGVITTNLRRDVTDEASQQLIDMNFFPPNLKRKDLGQGAATWVFISAVLASLLALLPNIRFLFADL